MAGPIKPKDVVKRKAETIPEPVFDAFNELIVQNFNGRFANIKLKTAADLALKKIRESGGPQYSRQELYDLGFMDVEDVYRKAGWKVEFDKPGYCETYDAYFTFSK